MSVGDKHVVVCGLGHVGYRVTRLLLRLGVKVKTLGLEVRADRARAIVESGGELLTGDARDEAELNRAGVADAQALLAVTDGDLANLEIALDARRLRPDLRLGVRVFDRDLARSLEDSLGHTRAVGVSALSAPVLAFAALGRELTAAITLGEDEVLVGELALDARSPLVDLTRDELRQRYGVSVLASSGKKLEAGERVTLIGERSAYASLPGQAELAAVTARARTSTGVVATFRTAWNNSPRALRSVFWVLVALALCSVLVFRFGVEPPISLAEAFYFTITTITTTGYGDITPRTSGPAMMVYASLFMLLGSVTMAVLYSFATSFVVSEQLRAELGRPPMPRGGHVIVVGLGNVGYRTWGELGRLGVNVVAIDLDSEGEFASALAGRAPFVTGDARIESTLSAAQVETAVAIIATTGDDAANLGIALGARRLSPKLRTIVRVFDADFAGKLEQGKLVDVAVSTSRVAAPTFAAAALFDDAVVGLEDDRGLTALCFGALPQDWTGRSPAEIAANVPLVERAGHVSAWDPTEPLPDGCNVLTALSRPRASEHAP